MVSEQLDDVVREQLPDVVREENLRESFFDLHGLSEF
jgi:hypothetical protein